MTRILTYIIGALVVILGIGCSATKGLPPDAFLYTGTKLRIENGDKGRLPAALRVEIDESLPQKNTSGLFNMRTGLYNIYDSTGTEGFRHMIKNQLGSRPKVFKSSMVEYAENTIQKKFLDYGYFDARVSCDTITKKRKKSMLCTVDPEARYRVDSIVFPYDSLPVSNHIHETQKLKYLKSGKYYSRADIISERERILKTGKNIGYAYMGIDDIIFHVDTTKRKHAADIYVVMRPHKDSLHYTQFTTGNIYINSDYKISDSDTIKQVKLDTSTGFYNFNTEGILNTATLKKVILLRPGQGYNHGIQKLTVNRLLEMGLFRFVNIKMERRGDTLDQYIYLTRGNIKSITGEVELNNRSGNIFGTSGNVRYTHKNAFQGGEIFNIGLKAGLETQIGAKSWINTSFVSTEASIQYPKLVLPFIEARTTRYFVPKTIMAINANYERRTGFYDLLSQKVKYGFLWKESKNKVHEFNPIDISYNRLINPSSVFLDSLSNNPRLAQSFQNILIPTTNYSYTYENSSDVGRANSFYQKATLELSGHTYRLIDRYLLGNKGEILKTPYAQYTKITSDTRKYWQYKSLSFATRLFAGAVFAYGNSQHAPFNRQFSIGGANSLRAFALRALGPGSFYIDTKDSGLLYWDRLGDVKVELNMEMRFPIFGFMKGALFVDAGNIWLTNTKAPILDFGFSDFYKEFAVGTGLGLRFDLNLFVLRTDFAFPLRKPVEGNTMKWTTQEQGFMTIPWLFNNTKINLGIGYPF